MTEKTVDLVMEIAQQLVECGAEIGRVEESITRICEAYGCKPEAYATPSNIIVTVHGPDGVQYTQSRRVKRGSLDLERIHRLNDLVRRVTATTPADEQIAAELKEISQIPVYAPWLQILFYAVIAGSFSIFFGGRGLREILFSFLIGGGVGLASMGLDVLRSNKILNRFLCSFLASLSALALLRLGTVETADNIIIGNIMSLIPGIGLTNALRDLFTGDTITGILRLMEAILLALAIALGYWVAVFLLGGAV